MRGNTLPALLALAVLVAPVMALAQPEPEPEPETGPAATEPGVVEPGAGAPGPGAAAPSGVEPAAGSALEPAAEPGPATAPQPKLWKDFGELSHAYRVETSDYTRTVTEYLVNQIQEEIARIGAQYDEKFDQLESKEEERRREAIAVFENFVIRYEKYKVDPRYRAAIADVLFRIGELYREQADYKYVVVKQSFNELMDLYLRGKRPSPPLEGATDYSKAVAVFWRLVEEFPEYRYRDMALYLLGYYLRDQELLEESNRALTMLTREHPDSEYAVGAWMLVGENHYAMSDFTTAVEAYRLVLGYPSNNPYYEDALYRLGWSSFQTFAYPQAIKAFLDLLDYYDAGRGRTERAASLQKESEETLANSFVDEDWDGDGVTDPDYGVQRAFDAINRGKPYERAVLKAFADTLYDIQDARHWEMAAAAYTEYIRRYPLDDLAPEIHDQIIGAYTYLIEEGPPEKRDWYTQQGQMERSRFLSLYGSDSEWTRVHQYDIVLLQKARTKLETALLERVELLHQRAQGIKETSGREAARPAYSEAVAAYLAYLEEFPDSQRSIEKRMDLAQAYFFGLEDYEKAAEQYAFVRDLKVKENAFLEEGAYLAIQSRQQHAQNLATGGRADLPADLFDTAAHKILARVGSRDEQDPTKLVSVEPVPIPPEVLAWVADAEKYLDLGLRHEENEDFTGRLAYLVSRVYYRYGHFEEAEKRQLAILEKFPDDELLSTYCYADLLRMATTRNDLDRQEQLANNMKQAGKGDPGDINTLLDQVKDARLTSRFQRSAELLKQAEVAIKDPAREKEARELYSKAAFELEKIVDENPLFRKADLALLSAAQAFETVKLFEKAANLYKRIVEEPRFKESDQRELATYYLARNYKLFFDFDRSIRTFQRLVQDYPRSEYRGEALLETATLQENDQDYVGAAATLKDYLARFPGSKTEPQIRLLVARLYDRAGRDQDKADAYRDFLRRYGKSPELVPAVLEAGLELGNLARRQDNWRDATPQFTMVRDLFGAAGLPPETEEAERAAEAAFWLLDRQYERFMATKITTTNYKSQQTQMKDLIDTQKEMEKALGEIHSKYKAYRWSVAAFYRIGMLWKHLAMVITEMPPPPNLPEAVQEKYQIEISDFGNKFEDQARRGWRTAINNARRLGISNEWTNRILVELNKYPDDRLEYPLFKEEKQVYEEDPLLTEPSLETSAVAPLPAPVLTPPPEDGEAIPPGVETSAGEPAPVEEPTPEEEPAPMDEPPVEDAVEGGLVE
ncbi:MAG: tetratricopeptide repeat protein [Deltaproteobacteria bacterium]|nr:tetratricopeptide repeat protein [Deltaproteobacteria bacterium]